MSHDLLNKVRARPSLYCNMSNPSPPKTNTSTSKTAITVGDVLYNVDISKIPYLSSFVNFQTHAQQQPQPGQPKPPVFIHEPIPLFNIALKGIESGYRQCFRSLPPPATSTAIASCTDLSPYHTLCSTYHFLHVDILNKQSLNEIIADLKAGASDYDFGRRIKGDKSKARDAAFKLLYVIVLGGEDEFTDEVKDSAKVFNAVLYVVSHPGTFKWRTRSAVRAAYEERFVVSMKQRAVLDKWVKRDPGKLANEEDEEDVTTEEELDYGWDSDYSD